MQLLDGKIVSAEVKNKLREKTLALEKFTRKKPHLAAILIGSDGASETYVASKIKNCEEVGFISTFTRFDADVEEKKVIECIKAYNEDKNINGILVQLPLPKHFKEDNIINLIDPAKDVDGFHPLSVGKLIQGLPTFVPATPLGIMLMLKQYNLDITGKNAVVIGRSNIVGRPMSVLLSQATYPGNCTVTLCHSKTRDLKSHCLRADIIVAALGKAGFLTADMVKPGAIVIDVGITRVADPSKKSGYSIKGDVDFINVAPMCSYISPVPGGVGLMTIAALLTNTYNAFAQQNNIPDFD